MMYLFALVDANASINANFIISGYYIISGCYSATPSPNKKKINSFLKSREKKMTETLHHALCAMMQFSVGFFSGDTSSPNKKNNSFLKSFQ
jgi:hypothetical protein